jgi:hypothetical protein
MNMSLNKDHKILEKLSFEGEVLIFKETSPLSQVVVQKTEETFESIHKFKKICHFKILIHTEGANSETTDKFYKIYSNGILIDSSFFTPKKTLEILNIKPNENQEFNLFEIKIYKSDQSLKEFFTLKIHLYSNLQKNPMLKSLSTIFKESCSKVSFVYFQYEKYFIQKVNSINCDLEKMIIRIRDKFGIEKIGEIKLNYSEMNQVNMRDAHVEITMKNSENLKFLFEVNLKNDVFLFFNLLRFIFDLNVYEFKKSNLTLETQFMKEISKELINQKKIVQQRNYSESIVEIEETVDYQLNVSIIKGIMDFKRFFRMKAFLNGEFISEKPLKQFGNCEINLKEYNINLKSNDKIELICYESEQFNTIRESGFKQIINIQTMKKEIPVNNRKQEIDFQTENQTFELFKTPEPFKFLEMETQEKENQTFELFKTPEPFKFLAVETQEKDNQTFELFKTPEPFKFLEMETQEKDNQTFELFKTPEPFKFLAVEL